VVDQLLVIQAQEVEQGGLVVVGVTTLSASSLPASPC
jgi:hypothetical protein